MNGKDLIKILVEKDLYEKELIVFTNSNKERLLCVDHVNGFLEVIWNFDKKILEEE